MNETAIIDAGFEGDWITEFIEIAIENIIPPFVEIKGSEIFQSTSTMALM